MSKIKSITIKEYRTTELWDLSSKDILEIEKINKLSKTQIFEIKAHNIIKAKQYVWIVKINNKNVQVLPKIFGNENEKILKNLLYMLSYTKKLNIKEANIANMWKIDDLFEVFVYIFVKELLNILKKDFKKNYNIIEENSNFLKWKLLFSKHIKTNLFNKSKFFVEYEKMDENILLNIFLKAVVEKLLKFTNSKQNYNLLKKCDFILKDIDNKIFRNSKMLNNLNFNRQNKEYKNVFSLWKILYFWNSPDLSGNFDDNFSILFDMNLLFEEFIAEFIKRNKEEIDGNILKVNSQVSNKHVFNEHKFRLKPDIILDFKDRTKLVIDTKYKKLDKEKNYNWVSSQDIYQMFMYGMRYFATFKEKNIILLYPDYDRLNYKNKYISEENVNIYIRTINLNFDLSSVEWRKKLICEMKNVFKREK